MNKIAIKPHKNRGNKIIEIFENRGFRNPSKYDGNYSENITKDYAFIGGCDGAEDCIILSDIVYLENIGYKVCTLEEYETNIGDKVEQNKTTLMSARDRGRIDEIIKALKFLEEDKMLCYADEIDFLKKIREW